MRKVFITGASRGIGKAAARLFSSSGFQVVSPGRDVLDLSSPESVENFIKNNDCKADVLINNAGINPL
ncbi:MAG: sugar nucleotide-binding protein, partial [Endomicrobia bacterium]|nr:sugar nucleotide-binding protein [Endomicrobiia bacterium]